MKPSQLSSCLAFGVLPLIFDMRCADPITAPKLCCWLVAAGLATMVAGRPWTRAQKFLAGWFFWSLLSCLYNRVVNGWSDLLIVGAGILWVRAPMPQRQRWTAVGFALTVAYSWLQHLNWDPFEWSHPELSQVRGIAGLGNPNYLSMYLACLSPWAWNWLYTKGPLGWLAGLLSLTTLLLTATRGSILILIVMLVLASLWVLVRRGRLGRFWVFTWGLLALSWFWSWQFSAHQALGMASQMNSLKRGGDESVTARQLLWSSAWQTGQRFPLLGVGFGRFGDAYLLHRPWEPENLRKRSRRPENPHNEPLKVLSETGWIGLLLWSGWIGSGLLAQRNRPGPESAGLMILLANSLSNCLPIAVWPLLLTWTREDPCEQAPATARWNWRGLPGLIVSLALGLPGWWVQHVFWWDDEFHFLALKDPPRALDYAQERIRQLGRAELVCPPWEWTGLAVRQNDAWQNLASLTGSKIAWEQAERQARRRISLEPENSFAWIGLAALFEKQGRYAESLPFWQEAQRRDSINPGTLFLLARAQYGAGQTQQALASLDRSLEIYSKSSQVYRFRAQIMIDQGMVWEGYWDWVRSQQVLEGE